AKDVGRLLARKAARLGEAEVVVRPILDSVRKRGDKALLEYARRFDGLDRKSVRVPTAELAAAASKLTPGVRRAGETASATIPANAQLQVAREWNKTVRRGITLGLIIRPVDAVAAYIPAGRYPLPSTVMMTVVPAHVAGVRNICVTAPKPVAEIL